MQLINQNQELVNNLLMSDEAHFHLSRFVNKQNFRYWSATNPTELHETTSHFQSHSMVHDIFIWNYWSLLLWRWERKGCNCDWTTLRSHVGELLRPELAHYPVTEETFSQQDGATSHTAWHSMGAVRNLFSNHVFPSCGDITLASQVTRAFSMWFLSLGLSEISSLQSSSTPQSSGVETLHSARSQTNSCGDASKSNGWHSQETYRVPRAEWWSSELCYFQKVGLLFPVC